jgi:hypothetical protein
MPQRLGRIDVAESRDEALIEQHGFDRTPLLRKSGQENRRGQRRVTRLRAKPKLRWRPGRVQNEHAQGTRIL